MRRRGREQVGPPNQVSRSLQNGSGLAPGDLNYSAGVLNSEGEPGWGDPFGVGSVTAIGDVIQEYPGSIRLHGEPFNMGRAGRLVINRAEPVNAQSRTTNLKVVLVGTSDSARSRPVVRLPMLPARNR